MQKFCKEGKWKVLKEESGDKKKGLINAIIDGKEVKSPKKLANEYATASMGKIRKFKENLPKSTLTAKKVVIELIPRSKEEFKIEETTISEMAKIIHKSKPSKSHGNDEVNMYCIKEIPHLMAICLTHLWNCMVRVEPSQMRSKSLELFLYSNQGRI